jgi:3-deoxy-D-manno-octulosonic-acid transferase
MGPHYDNFREIVEKLRAEQAMCIVEPADLTGTLRMLMSDEAASRAMGERAKAVFHSESGATARAVEALLALLPEHAA